MNSDSVIRRETTELDWLLDSLVAKIPGAEHAVVLSADGLALAASRDLRIEESEHLAAMASALHSLARGVGHRFDKGALQQTVVELQHGYLVVTEAGSGACLALLAAIDSDLGIIAYELNVIVGQVHDHLSAAPRAHPGFRPTTHMP
ncbi:roadblock/LC7 domain-containing protein [Nocardia farcinica]|uniref:roadblock/LC7 domain-containing protein n=1 Tax=Nocardia farcinica TaxID=37329 RepID=UPI001C6A4A5A|nr:roadblock/LC7 domain-containing protein [Nocardia farcinica]